MGFRSGVLSAGKPCYGVRKLVVEEDALNCLWGRESFVYGVQPGLFRGAF